MASEIISWLMTVVVALVVVNMLSTALVAVLVVEHRRLMERLNELPEPHRWRALSAAEWRPWSWMKTLKEKARAANLLRYGRRSRGL
jgi:hypothetical protein